MKAACWEAVNGQKGQAISGVKAAAEVHNFPLMKRDDRMLRKIMMLRRMEVSEQQEGRRHPEGEASMLRCGCVWRGEELNPLT